MTDLADEALHPPHPLVHGLYQLRQCLPGEERGAGDPHCEPGVASEQSSGEEDLVAGVQPVKRASEHHVAIQASRVLVSAARMLRIVLASFLTWRVSSVC